MRILFHKLGDDAHDLEVVRDDGSRERCPLESRSMLLHDMVHYGVEAELPLDDGFWGMLARGATFAALAGDGMTGALSPGLVTAESLVGPMQSVVNGRLDVARYRALAGAAADGDFVERVLERVRRVRGLWRATPWRGVMELAWPPPPL